MWGGFVDKGERPMTVASAPNDPDRKAADWGFAATMLLLIAVGVAVAVGLGRSTAAVVVIFPLILTVMTGRVGGVRGGAVSGLTAMVLVLLAAAVAPYPLLAALVMFGLIVWLAVRSAVQPPLALRKPFLLSYLVPALSDKLPDGLI